jgi:tetratricopeptide (TPR) repeat protein
MFFASTQSPPRIARWSVLASAAALLASAAFTPLAAQVAAGVARPVRLEVTTTSAEARTAFIGGLEDLVSIFPNRSAARLKKAVDLDPTFGLARVIHGVTAAGLTTAQRNEEIARGMADAAKASTGELMVATAYRESFRQNAVGARAILLAAGALLPDEPYIAHQRATLLANVPGGVSTDAIVALKAVIERFPDYAPAYNNLAYAQWTAGARTDAMTTAATYMAKAPSHPNSHDTYAELLQRDGNFDGAIAHYTKAIELDPTFLAAAYGLSEVYVLQGKGEMARQALTAALPNATAPAQRITIHNRIANSYVMEGNIKAAMTTLATVIDEATKAELNGAVAGAHIALMNLEAAFGDPKTSAKTIATHVGHVAAVPPPPPGAAPPNPAGRFNNFGTAYAIAGQTAMARVYLDSLVEREKSAPSPVVTSQVHGLTGWVLYSEGKYTEALAEFRQSNQQAPAVRSGTALTLFKLGNVVEARSIRDEIINDRNLNLANGPNVMTRRLLKVRIT